MSLKTWLTNLVMKMDTHYCTYSHPQICNGSSNKNASRELKGLASPCWWSQCGDWSVLEQRRSTGLSVCGVMRVCVCVWACTAGSKTREKSCLTPAMSSSRRLGYCSNEWCVLCTQLCCDWIERRTNKPVTLGLHAFTHTPRHILRDTII